MYFSCINCKIYIFRVTACTYGKQYITGYGIVFYREGDPSTEYELWDGAVERVHPDFRDRALLEKHDARCLFNHESAKVLGRVASSTLTLTKDSVGLRYETPYDENDSDHRDVKAKMDRGDIDGSSFAFRATKVQWEQRDDGTEVRWLLDGDIFDVGPVTYPAYGGATAGIRAVTDVAEVRSERDSWKNNQDAAKQRQLEVETFLMEIE